MSVATETILVPEDPDTLEFKRAHRHVLELLRFTSMSSSVSGSSLDVEAFRRKQEGTGARALVVSTIKETFSIGQQLRNEIVVRLISEWLADESGYDAEVWPRVERALRESSFSPRSMSDE